MHLKITTELRDSNWAASQLAKMPVGPLALAPANDMAVLLAERLEREEVPFDLFDRDPDKSFDYALKPYRALTTTDYYQKVLICSPNYAEPIMDHLVSLGVSQELLAIADSPPERERIVTLAEALAWARKKSACDRLETLVTDRDFLVIKGPYWYDLVEKASAIKATCNVEIVWISGTARPTRNPQTGFIEASWRETLAFARNHVRQAVFLLVHGVTFTDAVFVRELLPETRIVSYIYDWLPHSLPPNRKTLLVNDLPNDGQRIDSEYNAAERVLNDSVCDALIYKDGGPGFELYEETQVPSLFFPTCLPRSRYQEPPKPPSGTSPGKMLFVGTLFGSESDPEISGHSIFFESFATIAQKDIAIDIYYLPVRNAPSVVAEYDRYFANEPRVQLIPGKPLDQLLPQLAGRYHWGYMIAAADFGFAREHAAHTLPSRVFTYAALGIPIVVSTEFADLCSWVQEYGTGIVIEREQVTDLDQILHGQDYRALQENVLAFRETYTLERQKQVLTELFSNLFTERQNGRSAGRAYLPQTEKIQ